MAAGAAVELINLRKLYGGVVALDTLTLEVKQGEFITLLGPSGSGKTTTLMMIAGFEDPSAAVPKVVVIVAAALKGFDRTLERASMSLGAGPWTTFSRVTYPGIRPAVVTAALFAFLTSFDELILSMFITGPSAVTLPKLMWDAVRLEIEPTIAAASSLLIGVALVILATMEGLRRRAAVRIPIG